MCHAQDIPIPGAIKKSTIQKQEAPKTNASDGLRNSNFKKTPDAQEVGYYISWTVDGKSYKLIQDDGLTQEMIVDKKQISGYLDKGPRIRIQMEKSVPGVGEVALSSVLGEDQVSVRDITGNAKTSFFYTRNNIKRQKKGANCVSTSTEWVPFTITFTSYGQKKGDIIAGSFSGVLYENENIGNGGKCLSSTAHPITGTFHLRKPY
jgi:hypothetical protein